MHWALEWRTKNGNRTGMRAGLFTTFFLGLTFLTVQINEYVHLGLAPADHAQGSIFYGLTGLHGAHVFVGLILLLFANIRAFRGHFSAEGAPRRRGARHLLALRRRHVDRRLHRAVHHLSSQLASSQLARATAGHDDRRGRSSLWTVDCGLRTEMQNPLRSEGAAFRFLLYAIGAAAAVIVVVVVVRAVS